MAETRTRRIQIMMAAAFFSLSAAVSIAFASYLPAEGKTVTIMDGKDKKVVHTWAFDGASVLKEAKISLKDHDQWWISTRGVEDGSYIVVERALPVTVEYEGKKTKLYTTQQTVQGVIHDAGYDWRQVMALEDGMKKVEKDMVIHAVPYEMRTVTRTEALPPAMAYWHDEALPAGTEAVIDPGMAGQRKVVVEETVSNGKVIRSRELSSEVIDEGVPGVARIGSPDNTIGRVLHMEATAYHPSDGGGHGITASGLPAGYGKIAVDPAVIPLGTKVYIPSYGEAIAADTGGAIVGRRVDLGMETFSECFAFGRQMVDVYVPY